MRYEKAQAVTYNLHVDHAAHNYFANGLLAHNKDTESMSGMQAWTGGETLSSPGGLGASSNIPLRGGAVPVWVMGGLGDISFAGAEFHIHMDRGANMGEFLQTLMQMTGKD